MGQLEYVEHQQLWLKTNPDYDEGWLRDRIYDNPKILGLGDLEVRDVERRQPGGGRLDLLLQDAETDHRYETEIQLGATDETHIIRSIEYWDIERKRFPQYEHSAVLIAEDITSRFLNVIGLLNSSVPLIAIQLNAVRVGDSISLVFTTVLDQITLGPAYEDEATYEPKDRSWWETKGSTSTLALVDGLMETLIDIDSSLSLNYNKYYIGIRQSERPNNFVLFRPRKAHLLVDLSIALTDETSELIETSGLVLSAKGRRQRLSLRQIDIDENRETLSKLLKLAYVANT